MEIPAFWVRHVAISVADLEETIAWYRDCLGFVLIGREYVPPVEAEVATMARDGVELEIFCHPGSSPMTEERKDLPGDRPSGGAGGRPAGEGRGDRGGTGADGQQYPVLHP